MRACTPDRLPEVAIGNFRLFNFNVLCGVPGRRHVHRPRTWEPSAPSNLHTYQPTVPVDSHSYIVLIVKPKTAQAVSKTTTQQINNAPL